MMRFCTTSNNATARRLALLGRRESLVTKSQSVVQVVSFSSSSAAARAVGSGGGRSTMRNNKKRGYGSSNSGSSTNRWSRPSTTTTINSTATTTATTVLPVMMMRRYQPNVTTTTTSRCYFSSSSTATPQQDQQLCVADLRGAGWSLLERLCLEEFLAQTKTTKVSWLVLGMHEATEHRHLQLHHQPAPAYIQDSILNKHDYDDHHYNPSCAVIVKQQQQQHSTTTSMYDDLNVPLIERDGVLCLEYSGSPKQQQKSSSSSSFLGESVVLDHSAILTTLITSSSSPKKTEAEEEEETTTTTMTTTTTTSSSLEFMTQRLWIPTFEKLEDLRLQELSSSASSSKSPVTMVMDTKSCSKGDNSGRMVTYEKLGIDYNRQNTASTTKDNDGRRLPLVFQPPHYYCLGDLPIGMVDAKHHRHPLPSSSSSSVVDVSVTRTVFWWDYDGDNVSSYLSPKQRPTFVKLQNVYGQSKLSDLLLQTCREQFDEAKVSYMNPRDIVKLMAQEKTSLQDWWDHRTSWKIVQKF